MNSIELVSPLFFFFFCLISFLVGEVVVAQNTTIPFNVGVILDLDTSVGKMGMSRISMALTDFYATHSFYKTRLVLYTRDSKKDTVRAASIALDLLKDIKVQAIVGPETSAQANFVVDLGDKAQVPIVSFSATSPHLSPARNPYFIRASQNDTSQVNAITAIVQAFGWKEAITIYEDTEYGYEIIPNLINALQEINIRVPYRSIIPPSATNDQILKEIYNLMTLQSRVFIVHMSPSLGSRFFLMAKEARLMSEGFAWIITDGLTNFLNSMDPYAIDSMQGVLGVRPYVPKSKELDDFKVRWRKKVEQEYPDGERNDVNIFGLWAYDTVWALAIAAEKVGGENSHFQQLEVSEISNDLATLGVSQIGPKLLQSILKTKFKGLSGEFRLADGQLQSSIFQIVNVIGNGGREIGFWTPKNGILRYLNVSGTRAFSSSKANLRAIIWPGESTTVPKGWVIPTSGKKLKIGVPVKEGFTEFVKVSRDPITNVTTVTGYCIDVFKAVIEALPYAVPYEFIPFENPDGNSSGNYNDLVYQVHLQKYDAVVGDTTIRANRSLYVDFTLPYTESGVSMFVPIKGDERKNFWVFLKPLTADLWLTIGIFFIFTGFVIWVLEHRINDDFRGSPGHQVGTVFWFSFSTLVFAHKEKVVSNSARVIMIIWVFFVLILTSSYTASLASMLTVQQLQPTITDVRELLKTGESVGYLEGSFVLGFLKQMKFKESNLKHYSSVEECDDLLSKGSQNGGIAAAIDEIPYIKLLQTKYCDKYTMVGPTYKTAGFGFVFPKGSPLLHDVSWAVVNITEGEKMVEIEKEWFSNQTNCQNLGIKVSSNSLSVSNFRGLFLIAGAASSIALFMFSINFFYEHRHILAHINAETSTWQKFVILARQFDQKDHSSRTFRKTEHGNPSPNAPLNPSNISNQIEGNFSPSEEQGMLSTEFGSQNPNVRIAQGIMPSIELSNQTNEGSTNIGTADGRMQGSVYLGGKVVGNTVMIPSPYYRLDACINTIETIYTLGSNEFQ